MAEPTPSQPYDHLGAHLTTQAGTPGVRFAVWAPHAAAVSLIGDWNAWDPDAHPMRRAESGIWECFVPGLGQGTIYKFQIRTPTGQVSDKADPYAFAAELRPHTASVVWDIDTYPWNDASWLVA